MHIVKNSCVFLHLTDVALEAPSLKPQKNPECLQTCVFSGRLEKWIHGHSVQCRPVVLIWTETTNDNGNGNNFCVCL